MRGPIILALLLALTSTFFAARYLKSEPVSQKQGELAQVVTAAMNIPARTKITEEMVEVRQVPASFVHRAAMRSPKEVVGRLTRGEIVAGEQILSTRLVQKGQEPALSFAIPTGMRAVTVAASEVIGVAGFIKPGDRIDVLSTYRDNHGEVLTKTVLENVQVLAIAQERQESDQAEAKVATSVTVAVDAQGAATLTLAEEMGKLRLALRPAAGQEPKVEAKAKGSQLFGNNVPAKSAPRSNRQPQMQALPKPAPKLVEVIEGARRSYVQVD